MLQHLIGKNNLCMQLSVVLLKSIIKAFKNNVVNVKYSHCFPFPRTVVSKIPFQKNELKVINIILN